MGYMLECCALTWSDLQKECRFGKAAPEDPEWMVSTVRRTGVLLGSLQHSSGAAEAFLELFLTHTLSAVFGRSDVGALLTNRAILNVRPGVFPAWGGLRTTEIESMLESYHPVNGLGEDQAAWLDELLGILEEARARESDVITLYL
jgi:hypothetical protein